MTNYAHGHDAEKRAAEYLVAQGYEIVALNWRDRRAEIDIIARSRGVGNGTNSPSTDNDSSGDGHHNDQANPSDRSPCKTIITFVEVKYRESAEQGSGLEYITQRKLAQMRFAAELWMAKCNYIGEATVGAIEVSGPGYEITDFIPDIW